MEILIDLLKNCEITTILAFFIGFYIFNGMMNKKFDKISQEIKRVENDLKEEIRRVDNDIKEMRTSLNRMEGAFYSKDCCILKSDSKEKAE